MKNVGKAIAGTVLAVGMVFAQPGVAMASHYDGDVTEVITDKETYYRSEPIRVMAKYTNQWGTAQGFFSLDVRVAVRRVGALEGEPNAFYGPLTQVNPNFNSGVVEAHSAVILAQTTIPAYRLQAGLYEVDLVFQNCAVGCTEGLRARPWKVIQVK